jgi:Tfp pilus assembly protein PilZ
VTDKEGQPGKDSTQDKEKKSPCQVTFFMDDQVLKGTSTHFNEKGILVQCAQPAPLNKKIKIVLLFPGLRNPLEISGEVVWTNIYGAVDPHTPRGMGVKFMALDRDMERMLSELAVQYEAFTSIYTCYFS